MLTTHERAELLLALLKDPKISNRIVELQLELLRKKRQNLIAQRNVLEVQIRLIDKQIKRARPTLYQRILAKIKRST